MLNETKSPYKIRLSLSMCVSFYVVPPTRSALEMLVENMYELRSNAF